jgi:phytoene dehydrogenase-like protein
VSLLQPKVIEDLKLHERGLRLVERRAQNFLPLPDGRYLLTGNGRTEREIAKFSAKDAARYPAYQAEIRRVVEVLRRVLLIAPPASVTQCANSANSQRSAGGYGKPIVFRQRSGSSANQQAICSTGGSNPIPSRQCSASMR